MKTTRIVFFLASLVTFATASAADENADAGHFAKGKVQFTVLGGTGYAFDESYIVLGAGANYYVMNGLSVGLQLEAWLDGDPSLYKITPSVNYVFYKVPRVAPYIGAFYRYTDVQDYKSFNSFGGRGGVYIRAGRNGYFGVGGVYESYQDCSDYINGSCSETYPEISFAFSF